MSKSWVQWIIFIAYLAYGIVFTATENVLETNAYISFLEYKDGLKHKNQ